jgi:hypothetical protein
MAVTQNTYTGNGSSVLFSFTFPYLETTDIKVSLDGLATTAYTLANATTIQFNTAPANGVAIRIYRDTDDSELAATFYPGSALRSSDLNDNFTQNLYVTQEAINYSVEATVTADGAVSTANAATATANSAVATANAATATANTASSNASAAVSTANTASSNASAAVSTANTASSNASAAVVTANSAAADAATALSTANDAAADAATAISTANDAAADAATAISTANSAVSTANSAVSTANTADTNASAAVATADAATTTAGSALTTATTALNTANAAAAAVASAILYDTVANVAAIPASPANNDAVEVVDSTGIESFTPLSGVPVGYVGDSGLSVRIVYNTAGATWTWIQYFPNDPENRYGDSIVTLQGDVSSLQTDVGTLQTDVGTLQTDVGTLQTDLGTAQADIGTLQTDLGTAQGDISTLQSDVGTAQSDITTLQSDLATAQSDILGLDSSKLDVTTAASTYETQYTITSTAVSKTLVNRERCTVTAATLTITLPASPTAGNEVSITIDGDITDTIIARNGSNIMSLAEDMTIDKADVSVTLYYVDATRGWRVI